MSSRRIVPGLRQIRLPGVNAFLLDGGADGLALIDTGTAASTPQILRAVQALKGELTDLRHILVTHCHPDHAGSLADLKKVTGARAYMHRSDAKLVAAGQAMRRLVPSPGLLNGVLYRQMIAPKPTTVKPIQVDHVVHDRDVIPMAGGISVVHTPGHTEGHVAFLAHRFKALFVGDAAANLMGLKPMIAYEHYSQGIQSLKKIARYDFQIACFGHGVSIKANADEEFRKRWGRWDIRKTSSPRKPVRPTSPKEKGRFLRP
jgi:glyoxylase-like metal-dependent hydrolase (beta-lactamase superfamily II)